MGGIDMSMVLPMQDRTNMQGILEFKEYRALLGDLGWKGISMPATH